MSEKCLLCFRPKTSCYCKYIKPFDTGVKFVFIMHPKEAKKQRTGTGRLAHLTLIDSEIIVGIDFTQNKRLNDLISDPKYFPLLLYPDENALCSSTKEEGEKMKNVIGNKIPLIIVVDATWFFAKKMIRLSQNLHNLQKLSFSANYRSQYKFKTQPAPECLSTIESCYYLIKELVSSGVAKNVDPQPLMDVFAKMVDFQLESQKQRELSGEPDRYQVSGGIRAKRKELRAKKLKSLQQNSDLV